MSLGTRVSKVSAELSVLAEQYAIRTPQTQALVEQIINTGISAAVKGEFTKDYAKHLAAMAIGVLALLEPEEQPLLPPPS